MFDATLEKLNGLRLSSNIETAREEAIEVVDTWDFVAKKEDTINQINAETSVDKLTKLLWNTALSGAGLKVIRS